MPDWTNETAEWYAQRYGEYETNRIAIDAILLPERGTVIDIGCGTGAALRHASELTKTTRFIGIDPVPRMLEIARERLDGLPHADRIEFKLGSAEALPLEDHRATLALAFDSFDHWNDKAKGLLEVRRVLDSDGEAVFVKDSSVPGGNKAWNSLLHHLDEAGFQVVRQEELTGSEVRCRMLTAKRAG